TRSKRDWSSDVCSSDLVEIASAIIPAEENHAVGSGIIRHRVVVSAVRFHEWVHVCPCVRLEVVGPGVVRNTNAAHIPAEENHAEIGRASCRERGESAGS